METPTKTRRGRKTEDVRVADNMMEVLEGTIIDADKREVETTILRAGLSHNGFMYSDQMLRESIALFEGARAFADHPAPGERSERSVRDIVGYYKNPRFEPGAAGQPASIKATLKVLGSADWLWSMITECLADAVPFMGVSVDFIGPIKPKGTVKEVLGIRRLMSVDIVTRPSAGGQFERILNSEREEEEEVETKTEAELEAELKEAQDALAAAKAEGKAEAITEAQGKLDTATSTLAEAKRVEEATKSAVATAVKTAKAESTASAAGAAASAISADDAVKEAQRLLDEAKAERVAAEAARVATQETQAQVTELLESAKRERETISSDGTLELMLREAARMPEQFKELVRKQFKGQIVAPERIKESIDAQMSALAAAFDHTMIQGMGAERGAISGMRDSKDQFQLALDMLMGVEVAESDRGSVHALEGIREAYILYTGDSRITGTTDFEHSIVREADVTTGSFNFILGTSMNKRLLKEYQAWPNEWIKFCTVAPIKDFKQQDRVRLGSFGSLPIVAEDAPYTTVGLTDVRATYKASKYGEIVAVSREVIVNDDLQAIRQIPQKLAVAAAYSLAEFVYTFLSNGRVTAIYDLNTLFDAAAGPFSHGHNRRVDALATAGLTLGITTMKEQQNTAGKRIGLKPSFLVVPPELEFTALQLMQSGGLPGGNQNDINPIKGYAEVVVSPQLTNALEWYLVADPRMVDTIEIGFVGGQVNPVLLVQDQPLYGINFTQDAISYKVRHEYGGAVVDYRGFYSGGD